MYWISECNFNKRAQGIIYYHLLFFHPAVNLRHFALIQVENVNVEIRCPLLFFISVSLEFSTNHGRSWSLLHTECLPELCAGPHLPHSTIYSSDNYSGYESLHLCMWMTDIHTSIHLSACHCRFMHIHVFCFSRWTRISIPLPNAALTETTRFRWKQSGTGAGSMWAIDNG